MRPTEIYWLHEVPEHWKETKLKYLLKKHKREVPENAELLICSNSGDVKKRGDSKLGLVASSDDIYQGVKEGDLLIHGMDTWHGAIAISGFDGMCTPVVHVCTCNQSKRFVEYYLKMMIAWYFAEAIVKQPDAALPYFEQQVLPKWTHNKAISKACESFRVSDDTKAYLRTLRK